jgi:hypothetical protein
VIAINNQDFPAALWMADPNGDFEHDGITGIASFDTRKGIDLDIPLGSISPDDTPSILLVDGHRELPRIYGLGQSYDHITLVDAYGSTGFSAPGFSHESWHAQWAIVSRERFFEQDPLVNSATVTLEGLYEWCHHNPVQGLTRYKDSRWLGTEISVSSDALEDIPFYEDEAMKVCLNPVITIGGGELPLKTQSLTSDYRLLFRFKGNLPNLSEVIGERIVPFRDLLSLLIGFRAEILSVLVGVPELKRPVQVHVPFVEASRDSLSEHTFQRIPFTHPKVEDRLQSMAEKWLTLPDDARRAADIMLGILANERSIYIDSNFIAAASALEALSRVGRDQNDMTPEKFEEYLTVMEEEISNRHVLKWARHKLKYSNRASASKLAHDTLDELEPYASFVIPDRRKFEEDHRNARNAYVHQNDDVSNGTALAGRGLHVHTEAVLFLVWGKLLNLLGIAPSELVDALRDSSFRWNDLYRAQTMYKVARVEKGLCDNTAPAEQGKGPDTMDDDGETGGHVKPALTISEQVDHLKSQGVTFKLISEDKAADYLANANNYLRTRS